MLRLGSPSIYMQSAPAQNTRYQKKRKAEEEASEELSTSTSLSRYQPRPQPDSEEDSQLTQSPFIHRPPDLRHAFNTVALPNFSYLTPTDPTPPRRARFHDCYLTDTLSFQPTGSYFSIVLARRDREHREKEEGEVRQLNSNSNSPILSRLKSIEEYLTEIKEKDIQQVNLAEQIIKNCSERSHLIGRIEDLLFASREEVLAHQLTIAEQIDILNAICTVEEINNLPDCFDHQGKQLGCLDEVLFRNEYIKDRVEIGTIIQTFKENVCLIRVKSTGHIVTKFGRFLKLVED